MKENINIVHTSNIFEEEQSSVSLQKMRLEGKKLKLEGKKLK
jgi:hypothetical protein